VCRLQAAAAILTSFATSGPKTKENAPGLRCNKIPAKNTGIGIVCELRTLKMHRSRLLLLPGAPAAYSAAAPRSIPRAG
jgi:hypothetical protein